ncbi:Short-chain dehydrogenase TIC 32 [Trichoderma lentiforme]|uniref:Short-chain dehydrogenase TIC 32 n=1 Tax=Trichoderma lentiforme TaxID=1567552 RepID=A0A9P5CIY0_9HYPO|nr:Short-chain dehydrogenase TIC 32 [Trichoderma lentiforme]
MGSKGTIIVTGANGGLGSAIVQNILGTPDLASNYTGVYAVRKAATATKLNAALSRAPANHKHETVDVDLGSIADVRKVATDINDKVAKGELPRIRALILNAGYQDHAGIAMSKDGFEMSWQVNYLSNLLLSLLLLQSMDDQESRILLVGSWAHNIEDKRNDVTSAYKDPRYPTLYPGVEALAKGEWSRPEEDPTTNSGFRRYGASKLCAIMLVEELASRIAKDPKLSNISVIDLDPGGMPTGIARRAGFLISFVVMKLVLPIVTEISVRVKPNGVIRAPWKSAADAIRACFEIEAHRGEVLHLDGTSTDLLVAKEAKDEAKRKEVWEYGLKAAHIEEGDTVLVDWK